MQRQLPRLVLISSVLWSLTGLGAAATDIVASHSDAGKTISLHMGDALIVKLSGTHGSGHFWRLNADLTPELILSGRTTEAVDVSGAPETTSVSFTTSAPGTLTFKASYVTPGAPIPATDDLIFTVQVLP